MVHLRIGPTLTEGDGTRYGVLEALAVLIRDRPGEVAVSLETQLVEALHNLSPTKQQELLDFARKLAAEEVKGPRKSSYGALAGLGADISLEEFKEARREAWGGQRRGDGQ